MPLQFGAFVFWESRRSKPLSRRASPGFAPDFILRPNCSAGTFRLSASNRTNLCQKEVNNFRLQTSHPKKHILHQESLPFGKFCFQQMPLKLSGNCSKFASKNCSVCRLSSASLFCSNQKTIHCLFFCSGEKEQLLALIHCLGNTRDKTETSENQASAAHQFSLRGGQDRQWGSCDCSCVWCLCQD